TEKDEEEILERVHENGSPERGTVRVSKSPDARDKSESRVKLVFLVNRKSLIGGSQGTGKKKEIHIETEAEGRAHRGRLSEARRLKKGGGEPRLGDREQIGQGRQEERIGPWEKEQQGAVAQRREEGR